MGVARALLILLGNDLIISGGLRLHFVPRLDFAVTVVSAFATMLALIVAGLAPALQSTRADLRSALATEGFHGARPRWKGRSILISGQVAVSVILLSITALCVSQIRQQSRLNSGLDLERLALAEVDFAMQGYDEARVRQIVSAVAEQMGNRPGVEAVAASSGLPVGLTTPGCGVSRLGQSPRLGAELVAGTAGIFRTLGVSIKQGRAFNDSDTKKSAPVIVVNETTARKLFGTTDVIGRQLNLRRVQWVGEQERPIEAMRITLAAAFFPPWSCYILSVMLSEQTKGVFVISVTPFTDSGEIDYSCIDSLMDFYINKAVHGITILGMMGEAQKLSFAETEAFTKQVLSVLRGRVPVIVGVSNAAFANIRTLAWTAMDAGAAGVMIAPITGLRSDGQLYEYYAGVFEALGPNVPVAYQDYPQSTGVYLSAAVFGRMVKSFPQLVMLKAEDCPGLRKLSQIRADERHGQRRVSIVVGNGGLYLPQELRRGADGVMTGFAYPEMLVQVYERFIAGDPDEAEDVYDAYLPLATYEQQPGYGLAVRKEILRRRGAIASARVRSPGVVLNQTDLRELDALQERLARALGRLRKS